MKLYQEVTDRILAELESGTAPWLCPWTKSKANGTGIVPSNAITGRSYHGINVLILWGARAAKGYETNTWLTFKQARESGGSVARIQTLAEAGHRVRHTCTYLRRRACVTVREDA